jgi:DNA replication and repair protein RecF
MHLKKLSLVNFKNYPEAEIEFSRKINCFVGNNGVGKTNLLDSIHYLALCKSYFNAIDSQNISYNRDFFVIQGEFDNEGEDDNIYCGVQKGKHKQFKRNKKDYKKLSEHIGLIPLVMISPADSSLIMGGGEERRKFINGVVAQFDKSYLEKILRYNRVLQQRNKFLKTNFGVRNTDTSMLDVYDEQLAELGQFIYSKRKDFIENLVPVFSKFYNYISSEKEDVSLKYISQLENDALIDILTKNRDKDRIVQYTTSGIHRDDLEMLLTGHPLKKTGSQGQQKTFQLALKFGKFDFIQKISGKTPILLLDDVFDKFDSSRVEQLIRLVAEEKFGQIFVTDTDEVRINSILKRIGIDNKIFSITESQQIEYVQ